MMRPEEWPQPKRDTSGFLFLYPFYDGGYRKIIQDSPQHSRETNLRRANQVAAKAIEQATRLSRVHDNDKFPAINLEDPCGILPALPIEMSFTPRRLGSIYASVSLRPVLDREMPASTGWLGRLEIATYDEDDIHIARIFLNQPGEGSKIELGRWPGRGPNEHPFTDSYPANAQAMNFIGMADDYLDRLDQRRLVVVSE